MLEIKWWNWSKEQIAENISAIQTVVIYVALKKTSSETNTEENGSVDVSYIGIPDLPDGDWNIELSGEMYKCLIDDIQYSMVQDYVKTLESAGFNVVNESEVKEQSLKFWTLNLPDSLLPSKRNCSR